MQNPTLAPGRAPTPTLNGHGSTHRAPRPPLVAPPPPRKPGRPLAPTPRPTLSVDDALLELQRIREEYGETPMLLTSKHVAAMLQIGRTDLERMSLDGTMPCVRIGRRLRFPRQAIEKWVEKLIREQLGDDWLAMVDSPGVP